MAANSSGNTPRSGAPQRPSARVLRRRRAVFFGGLAVIFVVLAVTAIVLIPKLTGGHPDSAATTESSSTAPSTEPSSAPVSTPSSTASSEPSSSASSMATSTGTPAAAACAVSQISVTAATDAAVYPAGKEPVLSLQVKNTGQADCVLNVGTSAQEFIVANAAGQVFDSQDCQLNAADKSMTLTPGTSETANFVWKRNRTAAGCPSPGGEPPAAGQYTLEVKLGQLASPTVAFELQ